MKDFNNHQQADISHENLSIKESPYSNPWDWFRMKLNRRNGKYLNLEEDEIILFKDFANHLKNIEAVGGNLYMTTKRLIYVSHWLNIQTHRLYIALEDIQEVGTYQVYGLFNKGLVVKTIREREKFVVTNPDKWVKAINTLHTHPEFNSAM